MNIQIPTCFLTKWQQTLVLISDIFSTTVAIITSGEEDGYKVLLSNNNIEHPYNQIAIPEEACLIYSKKVGESKEPLFVTNALRDDEYRESYDSKHNLINYTGFPLFFPNGKVAGTLCIMDTMERHYVKKQIDILLKFVETINIDLEIITNFDKSKLECREKLAYEATLKKDNYFAKVMLKLNSKLHKVYSMSVVKRHKEQIDELLYLVSDLPYQNTLLDLPKLFRYLIPEERQSNIIIRLDDIDSSMTMSTNQATEIMLRIMILYILLEEINASVFSNVINNELNINFLLNLENLDTFDFENSIRESLMIMSEQYRGKVNFEFVDDSIYKIELIMPVEIS